MTVDLEAPTITATCSIGACRRTVGPYHHQRHADAALAEHVHWRHRAVYTGQPFPYDPDRRGDPWGTRDTD